MKTPEEMAKEYAETIWDESELAPEDRAIERHVAIGRHSTEIGFLAGYQAAKDRQADADKVIPQWISVKDRLPQINEEVIVALPFVFHDEDGPTNYKACQIVTARLVPDSEGAKWSIHTENGWVTKVTHWMPVCS